MCIRDSVKAVQEFEGVTRKSSIDTVTSLLTESYNVSGDVVIDIGDDASATVSYTHLEFLLFN